ncbi:general transcription factor 3C polypeptide 1 [Caerostris extrusa]|uniref:General transcription factor 3C polypeptide 1 n=1 Tax=Caerostris extrusa TaxID=172846 RepID=A0AAV4PPD1_CAEEX|nr:general transcription factor 3C polypeptide 1 [Caerostris extrusa]
MARILVVPATVVRDLLHKHVPEISADKSSRACQRRLSHPRLPKTSEEVWARLFTNLVTKLLEKFTASASDRCKSIHLPDSLEELLARYELKTFDGMTKLDKRVYEEPKNTEGVKQFVLTTLILSAMTAVSEDAKWCYLLYKLCQSFSENAITSTIDNLRKHNILALNKKSATSDLKRTLWTTGPYKLSVSYSNAMLTKFPITNFKECENLLSILKSTKPGAYVEFDGDVPSGYAATIVSLMQTKELSLHTQIPSEIILFDSSLSEEEKSNILGV